jgi:creatinine amidohydrolase
VTAELALFDLPHGEARRVAERGEPIYLTVNPVEYHGPHLSLHNDHLVSLGLCRALHARIGGGRPLIRAADLELGVDPTRGLGTRKTPFPMARDQCVRAARALADLGATRVVLMTFHGAPLHNLAIEAACEALRARGVRVLAPFHALLREMLMLDDVDRFADALATIADRDERDAVRGGLKFDFHAGFFETSMSLHFAPDSVAPSYREVPPCPWFAPQPRVLAAARVARRLGREVTARELEFAAHGIGWNGLRPFPGYTGRPAQASAAAGALFARQIVDMYEAVARAVLDRGEPAPPPIMPWALNATRALAGVGLHVA